MLSKNGHHQLGLSRTLMIAIHQNGTIETIAPKSALCELEIMSSEEGKSLSDFKISLPDLHKDQFIQNYLIDSYLCCN